MVSLNGYLVERWSLRQRQRFCAPSQQILMTQEDVEEVQPGEASFSFTYLPNSELETLKDSSTNDFMQKWGLNTEHLKLAVFRFDEHFQKYQGDQFVLQLFNSESFKSHFTVSTSNSAHGSVGDVEKVSKKELKCTELTMEFFDRLKDEGIVLDNGHIKGTWEDYIDGFQVSDLLRETILNDSSELYEVFSSEERKEFLFQLFSNLVLGGPVCQFEDEIQPYLDVCKGLYKDLISVHKNASTNKLEPSTVIYKVSGVTGDYQLFPKVNRQNFCYLSIDPMRRHVRVWYHAYLPYF